MRGGWSWDDDDGSDARSQRAGIRGEQERKGKSVRFPFGVGM